MFGVGSGAVPGDLAHVAVTNPFAFLYFSEHLEVKCLYTGFISVSYKLSLCSYMLRISQGIRVVTNIQVFLIS